MNVILIQAPFADPYFPSCALGILKKVIEKEGNSVKIVYANIMLLEELYKHGISSKGVLGPEHRKRGYPERLEQYYGILPDNLNNIPVPDYSEYFQMVEKYEWIKKENISILVEGSREGWWEKINIYC